MVLSTSKKAAAFLGCSLPVALTGFTGLEDVGTR